MCCQDGFNDNLRYTGSLSKADGSFKLFFLLAVAVSNGAYNRNHSNPFPGATGKCLALEKWRDPSTVGTAASELAVPQCLMTRRGEYTHWI